MEGILKKGPVERGPRTRSSNVLASCPTQERKSMRQPLSGALKSEIVAMRDEAARLQDEMTSPTMKDILTAAISDIDSLQRLFDSEDYVTLALGVPAARIKFVTQVKERYGANAVVLPGDSKVGSR
jgi:hypothetical protein